MGQAGVRVLVFTNLWPSSVALQHGSFVRERVRRLRARLGFDLEVVHPLPLYPKLPGDSFAARHSRLGAEEVVDGVRVHYPRYFHVPRFGVGRQAMRMERGCRKVFSEIVRRFEPHIVDTHYLYPDACAGIRLATSHGKPAFATARGSDVNLLGTVDAVRAQFAETLPRARRLMTVSTALARELERVACLPEGSVITMRNGVDLERFSVGDGPPEPRILCIARLVEIKRVDLLVRAMQHVRAGVRLDVVGSGPQRPQLERIRDELGLGERVRFLGQRTREDVAAELRRGGVFALASRHEGWPNALMEGLASGMFAVVSAAGGMPEILGSSETDAGVVIEVDADATAWGAALDAAAERLLRDGRRSGNGARKRAEALSWDHTIEALAGYFEEAAAQ
ncbi:MAG: glycosyltransferase [Planctomycetes bacterium]|nr:glycosyltransferase [Planctomycetota bacterium]